MQAPVFGAGILKLRSCDSYDWAVWHAFPGSHGWRLMPGNKTADGRKAWWRTGSTRHMSVWVTGGTGYWCTSGQSGVGWSGVRRDC